KYTTTSAPVRLSSGWEMRLIAAEAALVSGDAATAVDSMNRRRANLSLPLYDRTVSVDSAWSLFKRDHAESTETVRSYSGRLRFARRRFMLSTAVAASPLTSAASAAINRISQPLESRTGADVVVYL